MRPPSLRRTGLACAVAAACAITAACTTDAESDEDDGSSANPWQDWQTADPTCPVTLPMSPDRYPKALRDQKGKTTWYGGDGLWVDLAGFFQPARAGDTVQVRHGWWTVDSTGAATLGLGAPDVRATRLDGPGREVPTLRDRSDERGGWWAAVFRFPEPGCWLVTGELDDAVVRVVVKAR